MATSGNTEAMLKDDEFMQAVAQTIDALSFVRTHVPDMDFRAHSVNHLERVRGLQEEERKRVELMYGPRAPSPDFLGTQLLAEYRGEAASVQLGLEPTPGMTAATGKAQGGAISWLNDAQCRAFKKEIKQRIHEWERAVRESTGQEEVLPEQKTPLRAIYELYKVCKNRVLSAEAATTGPGGNASRAGSTTSSVPRNSGSTQDGGLNVSNNSVAATASATTKPVTQPARPAPRTSGGAPGAVGTANNSNIAATSAPVASTSNDDNVNNSSSAGDAAGEEDGADHAYLSPATVPGLPAGLSAVEVSILKQLPKVVLGKTAAALMPEPAIVEEKRRIKQVLHCFESEFERLQGERPGRLHRRGLSREYHRYGELKNELARRNSAAGGTAAAGLGAGSVSAGRPSSTP